jgi:hypothetical protein
MGTLRRIPSPQPLLRPHARALGILRTNHGRCRRASIGTVGRCCRSRRGLRRGRAPGRAGGAGAPALDHAQVYADHAGKAQIDADDVRFSPSRRRARYQSYLILSLGRSVGLCLFSSIPAKSLLSPWVGFVRPSP